MKKRLAAVAALAAIALPVTSAAIASAAPAATTAPGAAGTAAISARCGYYESTYSSYYNHCGPTNILVYVDWNRGDDYVYCLPPGDTWLGSNLSISNAWYFGGAGCSPVTKP